MSTDLHRACVDRQGQPTGRAEVLLPRYGEVAIIPVLTGTQRGALLFGATFIVVMISLLIQGWTVAPVARWLKLGAPLETH